MRAIGTGKRGGSHPGHTNGFTRGLGCAWDKQTRGNPLGKVDKVRRTRFERDWSKVCKALGKRPHYTVAYDGGMHVKVWVNRKPVVVYIDNKAGEYRHNLVEVTLRLIRSMA